MKLRSSLGNHSISNKLTSLLVTFSLFLALSGLSEKVIAQEKDNKASSLSVKDKYFTQLLSEIQREMRLDEDNKQLEKYKKSLSDLLRDFSNENVFIKEKKEEILDGYLVNFSKEISSLKNNSQLSPLIDKIISFLTNLQQKTAIIGDEKISAGSKEISMDVVETYIAKLTAFKTSISQNTQGQQKLDLLSSPSISLLLQEAKKNIQDKETQRMSQVSINDSLKQDYTKLNQYIFDLESQIVSTSTQIQTNQVQKDIDQKEFSTFDALGTNISEEDFNKKVQLMKDIASYEKSDSNLNAFLEKLQADLVVKTNAIPVKEVAIDQNIKKLTDIEQSLLDEKDKQYNKISDRFKQESIVAITTQEKKIEEQMAVLKESIDSYNIGIDSLTNALQSINEQLSIEFGNGEEVIKKRAVAIQKLLKNYITYSQELEKLYSMNKDVLLQNKEAIVKLEQDNPFIKTDISLLEQEKKDIERLIESLHVSIEAKEKEKSETIDDTQVISLINQLTTLYTNLQRSENSLEQTKKLLKQRQQFDVNYLQKKDSEIDQIDASVAYLDNNILSSKFAIEAFVYGYDMQLKKMEIQNISVKIADTQKRVDETTEKLKGLQNLENDRRESIRKLTGSPSQKLQKEKQLLVDINILVTNINLLKKALEKDTKLLKEYTEISNEQQKLFVELANLAVDALEAYLGYGMHGLQLKSSLNTNYPVTDKQPIDIPDFYKTIEMLLVFIQEAGIEPSFTIEQLTQLYK